MYKALEDIGEYKNGDEVPTELAETWLKMYTKPPVEKVGVVKESRAEETVLDELVEYSNSMLDDYLARNTSVVVKNIKSDDLSASEIDELYELEKSGKKRSRVLKALDSKK